MRKLIIFIFVFCWAASPAPNTAADATNSATPVFVFFTNRVSLSIEQMKSMAVREVIRSGATNLVGYHCGISITVGDPQRAAVALFSRKMGQPYYQVDFTLKGEAIFARTATAADAVGMDMNPRLMPNSSPNRH